MTTASLGRISAQDAERETNRLFDTSKGASIVAEEQTAKRKRAVRIRLAYHGALVEFAYSAEDSVPIHELEQSIDTMLKREGWTGGLQPTATNTTTGGNGKKPATWVDPEYDNNGDPRCPVHHKTLKQGTYGSYCPSKADAVKGEAANDKGYCSLKFKE